VVRNKHVIAALLTAPVLVILTWFAAGALFGEKPRPAQAGRAYPLIEKSNCRYPSGQCDLENQALRLTLRARSEPHLCLELRSSHAMESVQLSVADPGQEAAPRALEAVGDDGRTWRLVIAHLPAPPQRILLAATRGGSAFFAETSTAFLEPRESR